MITLYDFELSGNCYKLRLLMSILKLRYDIVPVDFYPGRQHKADWFLRLNPFGQLPVLQDGDLTLSDSGAILAYLARKYDETGQWFALWIADPEDAEIGRLSLFHVDPETDRLAELDGAPAGVPALPGFSIGEGRLAWATPRGQNGEGSRVQIVAWDGDSVGSAESAPGEDIVVVR